MKIFELYNTKNQFESLSFDLADDLTFFIINNQDLYRKYVYPVEVKIKKLEKNGRFCSPLMFKEAVKAGYKQYCNKFKLHKLDEELPADMLKEICVTLSSALKTDKENF